MNTKKKKLLLTLAINGLLLAILLLLFHPAEKTDDFVMKCILDGAMGYGVSAHLLYVNFFLGSFLKILTAILPSIAWFEIICYAILFLSFCSVTYILIDFQNIKKTCLLLFPLLTYWGYEGYIKLTFSKIAGIAIASGLFLVFISLRNARIQYSMLIIGLLLTLAGSLFRSKILYCILPIFVGILVIEIIILLIDKQKILKMLLKYGVSIILILFITIVISTIGKSLFSRNEFWSAYKDYNAVKVILQDYGWPDYYENQDSYDLLGVSYNDYRLWSKRDCSDPDIYTTDLVSQIAEIKEDHGLGKYFSHFTDFFKEYPLSFININVFAGALLSILLLFFTRQRLKWLKIAYPLLMALLLEYYLYCNGRYGKHHVDIAIWFAVALFAVYYTYRKKVEPEIYSLIGVVSALVLIFSIKNDYNYLISETYDGTEFTMTQKEARSVMNTLTADKENLYVLSNNEYYGLMRAYGTFESIPEGELDNIFILSSYAYPSHRAALEKYGYRNIYANMTEENVYYATSHGSGNVDLIKRYILEHYDNSVDYTLSGSIGGVNLYKFFSTAEENPTD